LERIVNGCRQESQKNLEELKKKNPKFSMNIEVGEEKYNFGFELSEMVEKFTLPMQLLSKGFEGIKNTVDCLGMPVRTNVKITGYSETEYRIPYLLESKERQILIEPLSFSGFMNAFGIDELEYSAFFPFFALDFFKYIDIMNAQKKPTIMAFIGLTDFQDVAEVNFLDYIRSQLKNLSTTTPKTEQMPRKVENASNIFRIVPENMFKVYGIPRFQMHLVDSLRISTYNPERVSERKKIRAYATSLGAFGFLNPTIVDYALFTTHVEGRTNSDTVGEIMNKGKALGHSPSRSKLFPECDPEEALENPLGLLKELQKIGMTTEIKGTYRLTGKGIRLVGAEVLGKPKEWSLSKIWNVARKAKDILPFLKFLLKG